MPVPRRPGGLRVALAVLAALAALAATGCSAGRDKPAPPQPSPTTQPTVHADAAGEITVSAPESLRGTLATLGVEFERVYPRTKVTVEVGGAPKDVVVADGSAAMKTVTDAGTAQGGPTVLARDSLVIAVPRANKANVTALADLARPGVRVALCAEQLRCGTAAKTVLDSSGVKVNPVSREPDAKSLVAKVRSGEVDAALIYRTDVKTVEAEVTALDFAQAAQVVTEYPIVALKAAANPTGAAAFIGFATSALARKVFTEAGFSAP